MSEGETVKVAVRVRPFNQREKDRGAKCVIEMNGAQTSIKSPDAPTDVKHFAFDYSYWSHDSFITQPNGILVEDPKNKTKYASQQKVFDDLGVGVLNNAFEGFNCSLFAYGQTGSGKSYSMIGYGPNRGIVPITCDMLFKNINENKKNSTKYEVTFAMMEIYNEQVRDLLALPQDNPKGGLPVRQNPTLGIFYPQGLKKVPVGSYAEIEQRITEGTANRTVASTNMNATSSRAHTVVTISFDQIIKKSGSETKKSSTINLVDLAGSERADSTGATGDRLKEGANINKSLSSLGNVISALAELSGNPKKNIVVPYRDSVLTKLLQNALGGNSKTVMIAALSPADINYEETLSTLRYADRAKQIKTKAVVNENPLDKMLRELREENERLKKLSTGVHIENSASMSPAEIAKMKKKMEEEIRAQLVANQEALAEQQLSWEEKLQRAREEAIASTKEEKNSKQKDPHLVNMNEDNMLAGVVFFYLDKGDTLVGRADAQPKPKITLNGISILKQHAVITYKKDDDIRIKPATAGAKIKVNGLIISEEVKMEHNDRILFGCTNHLYVYKNPIHPTLPPGVPAEIDWEFAQKEIAKHSGLTANLATENLSRDQHVLQEQILELLPMVAEANAISDELDRKISFELALISREVLDEPDEKSGPVQAMVLVKNLVTDNMWLWERGKFMNRKFLIQEMYQKYLDGEDHSLPQEEDPFWEPVTDIIVGTGNLFMTHLAYGLDFDDKISITDYKGQEVGFLYIHLTPCAANGKILTEEETFVDDPSNMVGKQLRFKVVVKRVELNLNRYPNGLRVKYKMFTEPTFTETENVIGTIPEFRHTKIFLIDEVLKSHLDYFEHGFVVFMVIGVQTDNNVSPAKANMTTKELRQLQKPPVTGQRRRMSVVGGLNEAPPGKQNDLFILRKKLKRLEQKERRLKELCEEWSARPEQDQQFEAFFREVYTFAYSKGTKVAGSNPNRRSRDDDQSDTQSLYLFGYEEEEYLEQKMRANPNGQNGKRHRNRPGTRGQGSTRPGTMANGRQRSEDTPTNQTSKACVIQ